VDPTWTTLGILLAGLVVVVGGVLVFRLHAFLALVLGACVVSALTPAASIERDALSKNGFRVVSPEKFQRLLMSGTNGSRDAFNLGESQFLLEIRNGQRVEPGEMLRVFREADDAAGLIALDARLRIVRVIEAELPSGKTRKVAVAQISGISSERRVAGVGAKRNPGDPRDRGFPAVQPRPPDIPRPGDLAVPLAAVRSAETLAYKKTFAARVTDGFGRTCGNIGILIALASIIGTCLLESGAADRIVRSTLRRFGERGAPASFVTSGFLLGIPVFFDTVFYLMIPLGKAMRLRVGRNYLLFVLTIVAGATMAHSLVPPTPGPLFVAEQLGVDIGVMILGGCIVGLFTVIFGYVYAGVANRLWDLPLRETPELSLSELEAIAQRPETELPPFWLSLLPIVLPVLLIGGYTVLKRFPDAVSPGVMDAAAVLGDKNVALGISAAIALGTLVWQKKTGRESLAGPVQASLASGGVIILITAAGGAFGTVLQQTGVAGLIRDLPLASPAAVCGLAFLITAAIRTAQGSATVAMITAVGILSGLATGGDLGFHPVYLALAIGCGSKPIGWMNDSGFWVITKMSGMTEAEGLKYVTPMTAMMGVVGLVVTMIGVTFFPLG
jgi:GntP family gluconate:H+ symporter